MRVTAGRQPAVVALDAVDPVIDVVGEQRRAQQLVCAAPRERDRRAEDLDRDVVAPFAGRSKERIQLFGIYDLRQLRLEALG